jgi:hypothetical protein
MRFAYLIFLLCLPLAAYSTDVVECTSGNSISSNIENSGIRILNNTCGELNNNVGTINGDILTDNKGILTLNGDINTITGNIIVSNDAVLTIEGDISTIEGSITVGNGGQLIVNGDIAQLQGNLVVNNSGSLLITGNVTAEGGMEVKNGGTAALDGGTYTSTDGGVELKNGSTLTMSNASIITTSTGVDNSGTITVDETGNVIDGGVSGRGTTDPSLGDCTTSCIDNTTLPVELLYFEGKEISSNAVLEWATTTEINNDYFEIEKSFDGFHFQLIGKVQGNGSTKETMYYSFADTDFNRSSYYRLKQKDFDGTSDFSDIIFVESSQVNKDMAFTPNPFSNQDHFRLLVDSDKDILLNIISLEGRMLYTTKGPHQEVERNTQNFLEQLKQGLYFLEIRTEFGILNGKLLKRD